MNKLTKNNNGTGLSFARAYTQEDLDSMVERTLEMFNSDSLKESNEAAVYNIHNLLENIAEYAKNAGKRLSEREAQLMQESAGEMSELAGKAKNVKDPREYIKSIAKVIDESITGTSHAKNSINLSEGKFGEYTFSAETQKKIEDMKQEKKLLENGS